MNTKYIWLLVILLGFTACNEIDDVLEENNALLPVEEPLPALVSGSADFSNYVALGASFTAGFTDGGLFIASQEDSFPNILAKEFAKVGTSSFVQPLMNDNFGGLAVGGTRIADPRLVFGGAGPVPLESIIGPVTVSTDIALNNPTGPFNNLGVPGAKSFHLVAPGYGNLANLPAANPYAVRLTGSSPNATLIELAAAQGPTFFTLSEIGGNDVLSYATSGGSGVDQTGNLDPSTYGGNDITDPNVFANVFSGLVETLVSALGAKGVVTNVPYITDLPHFTTVPYNPIPLDDATADFLNSASAYGAYNGGIQAALAALAGTGLFTEEEANARLISFSAGEGNAVVIEDESLTDLGAINPAFAELPKIRQATAADLFVLPSSSFIGTEAVPGNPATVNGVAIPLADRWVLTPEEQEAIKKATDAYNETIAAVANGNENVALVDLNSILGDARVNGVMFDNYTLETDLVTGGLVSLDGIHLTGRGYAYMANKFLEAIDAQFGSNFVASGSVAKAGDYPTNYSPALQ